MFNGLKEENLSQEVTETIVVSEETLDALLDNLSSVPDSIELQRQYDKTRQELTALISAIETHRAPPALLAFANYNGVIGQAVSSIPSLETLSAEPSAIDSDRILSDLRVCLDKVVVAQEAVFRVS